MFKGHCFPKAIILQANEYQPTSLNRKWSKRIIGPLVNWKGYRAMIDLCRVICKSSAKSVLI